MRVDVGRRWVGGFIVSVKSCAGHAVTLKVKLGGILDVVCARQAAGDVVVVGFASWFRRGLAGSFVFWFATSFLI